MSLGCLSSARPGASRCRKKTSINKSTARPAARIIVDVDFGTIDVSAGADDKVVVEAHRKIDSNNEAQEKEYLAAVPVTVTKEGNTVTIRARRAAKGSRI